MPFHVAPLLFCSPSCNPATLKKPWVFCAVVILISLSYCTAFLLLIWHCILLYILPPQIIMARTQKSSTGMLAQANSSATDSFVEMDSSTDLLHTDLYTQLIPCLHPDDHLDWDLITGQVNLYNVNLLSCLWMDLAWDSRDNSTEKIHLPINTLLQPTWLAIMFGFPVISRSPMCPVEAHPVLPCHHFPHAREQDSSFKTMRLDVFAQDTHEALFSIWYMIIYIWSADCRNFSGLCTDF